MSNRRATILAGLVIFLCLGLAGNFDMESAEIKYGVSDEH